MDPDAPDIRQTSNVFLVRSEHLNHEGHLFGGDLMAEIDTVGFCLLRGLYPRHSFVTRAATIEFAAPARLGDVVRFTAHVETVGCTSVQVDVRGFCGEGEICRARMTYVRVGPDGRKCPVASAPGP
jgi:acyl-CoA hydrolase